MAPVRSHAAAQLRAILWKNLLLKRARIVSTCAEILLPVFFMLLLIAIKAITTTYEAPNVAYDCGNARPWSYGESLFTAPLLNCSQEPSSCSASKYYSKPQTVEGETIYKQYGETLLDNDVPLYTFTIGDNSSAYELIQNPSLPFSSIIKAMKGNDVIFAVTGKTSSLYSDAANLTSYLKNVVIKQGGDQHWTSQIQLFDDEGTLNSYVRDSHYDNTGYSKGGYTGKVAFGIVLEQFDTSTHSYGYKIRANYSYSWELGKYPAVPCLYNSSGTCEYKYSIPETDLNTDDLTKPTITDYLFGYGYSGFSTIQKTVDEYIFYQSTGKTVLLEGSLTFMTERNFKSSDFQYVISGVLGIFYMLAYLYPVSQMIRLLVLDKEEKLKEGMRMMGLTELPYNLSWAITLVVQFAIISAVITGVTATTVFEYSDKGYIFLYFFMFSVSIVCFAFLMASVFQKSKVAALLGPLLFFVTFFPSYAVTGNNSKLYSTGSKVGVCLLAPSCFALGADVIATYEGGLVGVQSSNVAELIDNLSFNIVIGMFVVDAVLYGVLAWYIDKIWPSEFGTQLPWYFPFSQRYWCGANTDKLTELLNDVERSDLQENQEPVGDELRKQIHEHRCVQIKQLRKVFKTTSEDRVAVKGLDMEMYEGQITVLLGHNGAGKSTTISMLTGLLPNSGGDAIMRGLSINENMAEIRRSLGVCPQHDILFPELTVYQHLSMFATFKGVPAKDNDHVVVQMITEVGLAEKKNVPSRMLSGGMKRKLCVGIALIGDSKIVILDEPTSGMDPYSRRSTWNILQRNKRGRVMLLTTHFMDEADNLGDRIAIMASGELKCIGSSLFLKNRYGVGYTMTVVKDEHCSVQQSARITDVVKKHVHSAESLSSVGAEQSYRLPFSESKNFVGMFQEIDTSLSELMIREYGISVTTLEEVFIRVGHNEAVDARERSRSMRLVTQKDQAVAQHTDQAMQIEPARPDRLYSKTEFYSSSKGRESEAKVFVKHFQALLKKRAIYGMRDRRVFVCQLVLPMIVVLVGLGILEITPSYDQPTLKLSPSVYNTGLSSQYRNPVPFYTEGGVVGEALMKHFNNKNVYGYAVEVQSYGDQFSGCAQGPSSLKEVSDFLLGEPKSSKKSEKGASRYGAVTISDESTNSTIFYNAMINGSSCHGAGIYPNLVHTSFLQYLTGVGSASISTYNHPLPRTFQQQKATDSFNGFISSIFLMIAFCFIPASYAIFIVKEREVKAKHQQIISGVSLLAYWSSSFMWDIVSYVFPLAMVIALIHAFQVKAFTEGEGGSATFLVFLLYGPSVCAFTYMMSYIFKSHSTAQNIILFFNFISGLCLMVVYFTLLQLGSSTAKAGNQLRYLFRLFPAFCLGDSLLQLAICSDGKSCPTIDDSGYNYNSLHGPYKWDTVGGNLVFMAWEVGVYFLITLLIEWLLSFPAILSLLVLVKDPGVQEEVEDDDVAEERRRVATGGAANDVVRLESLRKVYPSTPAPKVAVQSLSFGIPKGECFGFLGINGAGKSTTLSILSGEFPPTSGNAFIDGYDIRTDQIKIRRKIGYCPQFDALLELLTVREHLELYARIKGVPDAVLQKIVDDKLVQMDLTDFATKAAGTLSGGNKRKLSVAIALMGEPSIVFLDEPSTGMDPVARRFMWGVISRISTEEQSSSIILTTHSMEEAEALCTRIGIMVNGRLRCLGGPVHLKLKFGAGYEMDIRTRSATSNEIRSVAVALMNNGTLKTDVDVNSEDIFTVRLSPPLQPYADALGIPARAQELAPGRNGALLAEALAADGHISLRAFADWWFSEDFSVMLHSFVTNTFEGAVLLERSTQHSFRYRVPTAEKPLSAVFAVMEDAKERVNIEGYSVAQTTLEQIFNQLAASSSNPEVAAAASN